MFILALFSIIFWSIVYFMLVSFIIYIVTYNIDALKRVIRNYEMKYI